MVHKPAVAVVFHHIGPYHHARLNAAADRLSVTGIEWSAEGYDAWGAAGSPLRYKKISLFPKATADYPRKAELRRAFFSALEQANPDVVAVNGWNNFGSLVAANCCMDRGIRMVVMSESARGDEPRSWWKEIIKRRIVNRYSAALVGGQRHVEYLVELGVPQERIFTGYDVVDNDYFAQRAIEIRDSKSETRKKYGLPENYFLASARFIEKKNLPSLIIAYAEYRQLCRASAPLAKPFGVSDAERSVGNPPSPRLRRTGAPWDLVLLGDGPLRETLNSQLSTLNLHANVHLLGFKQYDELPIYYALANAFVHASTTEQWGLVVNEAIASGLPVIVSDRCGCVPELVQDNGFTFDPMDEHELASLLLRMTLLSENERRRLAEASYRVADNFAPARFAEGLERAAMTAMNLTRKRFGLLDQALLLAAARYGR